MPQGERAAVLLDQHPLWLDAVEQVLARVGVDVAGKTSSSNEALALIERHEPDLFITELELTSGKLDSFTCLRQAAEKVPTMRSIVLSMHDTPQHIEAALAAGAVAYVVKTAHPDDLASAVRQAFSSSLFFAGSRGGHVVTASSNGNGNGNGHHEEDSPGLTKREIEILRLVSEGHSNAELAKMLWVTEQTVKFHLSNIYRKLDVSNRTEASRWAQLNGLLTPRVEMSAA
jgi:DNA-binding NarL/FixJ family response regulator